MYVFYSALNSMLVRSPSAFFLILFRIFVDLLFLYFSPIPESLTPSWDGVPSDVVLHQNVQRTQEGREQGE